MCEKLLSVIVPVYNAGEYLAPLIQSVLNQTWSNIELILIDDGSNDGSAEKCDEVSKIDKRVKVVHQKNSGQSAARNKGLQIAQGDIIAFADHDDLLHPHMYEILIKEMEKTNVKVCAANFSNVPQSEISKIEYENIAEYESITLVSNELIKNYFTPTWKIPIWTKVYERSVVENMKFTNHHLGEDNMFSYNILKNCGRVTFINKQLYFQRMHGNNFEFTGFKYYIELLQVKEKILRDIKENFIEEYYNAQKLFFYECIRIFNIYIENDSIVFQNQIIKIVDMIRKNTKGLFFRKLPLGHKKILFKIKFINKKSYNKKIHM